MLYPPCYYYYYYAIVPCYIPRQPSLKGCWLVLTQDQKALLKLLETARKNAYEAGIRDVRWHPALSNLSSHQTWLVGKIYRLVGTFIDFYDFIWFIIWLFVGSLDSGSTTGARQQHFFLDVCSLSRLDHRPSLGSLGTANRTKVQLLRLLQTQKEKTLGLRLCNGGGSAFLAKVYSGLIQNLLISW